MGKAGFLLYIAVTALPAQTLTSLANFSASPLLQSADGNFYGTYPGDGGTSFGTIFRLTAAGSLTTLHTFSNGSDGGGPVGLIQATDGDFYGGTTTGGANGRGTIFKITSAGELTTLYDFSGVYSSSPAGRLMQAADGNFYGCTFGGGANDMGTIFSMTPAGVLTTLHTFGGTDGSAPGSPLLQAFDGYLYGFTAAGGSANSGAVFRVTTAGTFTLVHSFTFMEGTPSGGLIQGLDGNLYGTTNRGGANNAGTIYEISAAGSLTILYSFAAPSSPGGTLMQTPDGNFYGSTPSGGLNNDGTIFRFSPSGSLTTLYSFAGTDGANPSGSLLAASGNLYGATLTGGTNNNGTVFSLRLSTQAPTVSTLAVTSIANTAATFQGAVSPNGVDTVAWFQYGTSSNSLIWSTPEQDLGAGGAIPFSANIGGLSPNTTYYFQAWGSNAAGTTLGQIESFTTSGTSSASTISGTIQVAGSALSGVTVTVSGSQNAAITTGNSGAYFAIVTAGGSYSITPSLDGYLFTPASRTFPNLNGNQTANFVATYVSSKLTFATLATFSGANGSSPTEVGLLAAPNGNLYGTTSNGGAGLSGTIFQIAPSGTLSNLYAFSGGPDGSQPSSGLIQAYDGDFYGTTKKGGSQSRGPGVTLAGANNMGTIYRLTSAGVLTTLYDFTGPYASAGSGSIYPGGANPVAGLIQGKDGNFYGVTTAGGVSNYGTVFKFTSSGAYTTLHSFTLADGSAPNAAMLQAADGSFYGTTSAGGPSGGGVVFRISPSGSFTILYSFSGPDGKSLYGSLVQGTDGNFYGTTAQGGANSLGTVFRITPAGALTTLHSFSGSDGAQPYAGLIQGFDGNFYGTTCECQGAAGYGTVFMITPAGTLTTLHAFNGSDGAWPMGALIQNANGAFYGTTVGDVTHNQGTVFTLAAENVPQVPSVSTGSVSGVTATGAVLTGTANPNGTGTTVWFAYGTASSLAGSSTTARLDIGAGSNAIPLSTGVTGLTPNTIYYFQTWASNAAGTSQGPIGSFTTANGTGAVLNISGTVQPSGTGVGGVTVAVSGSQIASTATDAGGRFTLTVAAGGTYTLTPSLAGYAFNPPSQTFTNLATNQTATFTASFAQPILTTLVNFDGTNGAYPQYAPLLQAPDGNFYGTTRGGSGTFSTVFRMTPAGDLKVLHTFALPDGIGPYDGVVQGSDGNLYGTTPLGGAYSNGTIFKITPAGNLTTVYNFCASANCADGRGAVGGLLRANDGFFYGTTAMGGNGDYGTVYKIGPTGILTTVHSFAKTDGYAPLSSLIQDAQGNLYGTTSCGGTIGTGGGYGTVFKISLSGVLTTLHTFSYSDGAYPGSALLQAADGSFYGATYQGGDSGAGTIFKITPAGGFTSLYSFAGGGQEPYGALIQGGDGNFYGTTFDGGNGLGTIFRFTAQGGMAALYSFSEADGANPLGPLLQASDGKLYGTTSSGGVNGLGTVFSLALAPPAAPAIAQAGMVNAASFQPGISPNSWITITGSNLAPKIDTWNNAVINGILPQSLDGVTVSIGGQQAYISYISPTQINALAPNVPPGNLSVVVSAPSGSSAAVSVAAQTFQPAFFEWPGNYAAATRLDYSLAAKDGTFPGSTTVPAKPGDYIVLWGTGFGPTSPPAPDGVVVPQGTIFSTSNSVTVTVGGVSAPVYSSTLTSGAAGLYQVTVQIPDSLGDGDFPVVAAVSGVQSPSTTLITIHR